jgi:preprotein translocase subunit Sss1
LFEVGKVSRSLKEAFENIPKVLELAEKPSSEEFKLVLKLILIGFMVLGLTAFAIVFALRQLLLWLGLV